MKRSALLVSIALLLIGLVFFGDFPVRRVGAARPYEGQTIRAVVNAEYVKYSLSLVEKDLYDKLGVKIETEVIPLDAFVSKTLLEFNSGGTSSCSARRTCRTTGGTSSPSSRGSRS